MFDSLKSHGYQTRNRVTVLAAGMVLFAGAALICPTAAGASGSTNTFTFTGTYSGTLKLTPSNLNCMFGKTYSGKGFLVSLSHMTGTITGAGKGKWTMTAYPLKKGTTTVAKANVQSLTESSFQSNAFPIISFLETSGSITYEGSKGSIDMKVEFHQVGSQTYTGTSTVTGSWNCND
jgi:hypothetical protein